MWRNLFENTWENTPKKDVKGYIRGEICFGKKQKNGKIKQ